MVMPLLCCHERGLNAMKKGFFRQLVCGLVITVTLAGSAVAAFAAEDSVEFSDRYQKIEIKDDKDLFSNMKELLPGGNAVSNIKLKNNSAAPVSFYLYAVVNKDAAIVQNKVYAEELIKMIELTLRRNGTEVLYKGPASGNPIDAKAGQAVFKSMALDASNTIYGINLGSVKAGGVMDLSAEIFVPGKEIGNEYQNSYALVDWHFCCEGIEPNPAAIVVPTATPIVVSPPEVPFSEPTITPETTPTPPVTVEVPENPTPEDAPLPKTGSYAIYIYQIGAILVVLVAGLVIMEKVRKSNAKK